MPYRWDRGWGGAVLLACFVMFPALALVVRWRWRLAERRLAEIIRLMRLATAEAERAEREAAVFPSASDSPASAVIGAGTGMSNCAVCHRPTTTRCARCKVVKYWCKSYERAKKQLTILEAPNVLTVALKRYQFGKFGKLNKMVQFPEYLNLAPYMKGSDDKSPLYRLFAVVVHNDVMNSAFSGHYASYVKNAVGKWFKADDSMVKQVDLQAVLCQGAYMLLYARCSPRAPSLLRKEIASKNRVKQNEDSRNSKARSFSKSSHPGKNQAFRSYDPKLGLHDLFDERLRQFKLDMLTFKLDMSSESSSLFSCSDEGSSWSAESTKGSATTEDYTESINGEQGLIICNSPDLRFSEDLDGFTLPPNSNGKISDSPDLSPMDSRMVKGIGRDGEGDLQGKRIHHFCTLLNNLGI